MRVLVTGWAGYIGPHVLAALARYFPVGLDTCYYVHDYAERPWFPPTAIFGDIRSEKVPGQFDVVVHMAGLSNDPIGTFAPGMTRLINYGGTLTQIRHYPDAHHVVLSSCSVYGKASMAFEDTPVRPLTVYAESKAEVDGFLAVAGFPYTSLRLGTVYGYSRGHRIDLVVNRMAWDAVKHGRVTVTGNAARPLVHVEDVAEAVRWAAENRPQGVFNVVGENWRMGDLGETVAGIAGVDCITADATADARDYFAVSDKIAAAGFRPSRTVSETLLHLIQATRRLPDGRYYERLPVARPLLNPGWSK